MQASYPRETLALSFWKVILPLQVKDPYFLWDGLWKQYQRRKLDLQTSRNNFWQRSLTRERTQDVKATLDRFPRRGAMALAKDSGGMQIKAWWGFEFTKDNWIFWSSSSKEKVWPVCKSTRRNFSKLSNHPVVSGTVNVCDLVRSDKLKRLTIDELTQMCRDLEVDLSDLPFKRRKKPFI